MNKKTVRLTRTAIISALYVLLSLVTLPISGGVVQFRIAESLTLLPLLYFESIFSVFIGCFLFNLLSGLPFYDVLFGSLITLISAFFTYLVGRVVNKRWLKIFLGGIFPVLLNAILLPLIWFWLYGKLEVIYAYSFLSLLISQSLSVYLLGSIEMIYLEKMRERRISFLE